jgi:hypothetical protein
LVVKEAQALVDLHVETTGKVFRPILYWIHWWEEP